MDGDLVRERVSLERADLRALERIDRLSGRALALVVQVESGGDEIALDGERSEFAELRECITEARKRSEAPAEVRKLDWLHQVVGLALE